ncbi:MAG: DinB family protein [Dehalococcoidia bacterium]
MNTLETLFDHHEWATLALIDHCAGLPPEVLEQSVPGTAGSIRATLVHLVAADQRYLRRMPGEPIEPAIHESMQDLRAEQLRPAFQIQARRWRDLVAKAGELDVTLPGRGEEPDVPHAADLLFLQAIHHGNDHRTHVCTILGALGLEAPELDGWHYLEHGRYQPESTAAR